MATIALSTYSFGPEAKARDSLDFALTHGFHGLELGSYTLWPQAIDAVDRRHLSGYYSFASASQMRDGDAIS